MIVYSYRQGAARTNAAFDGVSNAITVFRVLGNTAAAFAIDPDRTFRPKVVRVFTGFR